MDIDFSPAIWAQERNFLYVSNLQAGSTHVLVEVVGHSELSAKYAIPPSHSVDVDITDVVRMYETGTFKVSELSGDTVVEEQTPDSWLRAGLINPTKVLIPDHDLQDAGGGAPVIPPNKILLHPDYNRVLAECCFAQPNWRVTGDAEFDSNLRKLEISGDFMLATRGFTAVKSYSPEYADTCTPLAFLSWVSFTGATRIHVFKVVQQATEAVDEVEMMTADNSYDIRKGRRDSVTLRLDGLNRYDLWYYGDVVTSSFVVVSFGDGTTSYRAEVTTKKIELPANDEGALSTLEVSLNYSRYDTI